MAEIGAIAVVGVLGAVRPEWHIFRTPGFIAITGLTALSLAVVVTDRVRRLAGSGFNLSLLGSVLLHAGLLAIVLGGMVRALFGVEAAVDLYEGETLPTTAAAWGHQYPGLLAGPLCLDQPVTLNRVSGSRYDDGSLRNLSANLSVGDIAVNHQMRLSGTRLFLGQESGCAVLVAWSSGLHEAVLLDAVSLTGVTQGPEGLRAYLRAASVRPASIEVRVMRGGGLITVADVRLGGAVPLPGGGSLTVCAAPMWTRLGAARDPGLWLVYGGFALVFAGTVILLLLKPLIVERPAAVPGAALAGVLLLVSCRADEQDEARRLVTHYNEVVSEAYRRGDVKLIDPVVGPNEGKKLTGLIGVRLDMGLTLDSQLLSLDITRVTRGKDELRVYTRERWHYRDRRIGTGEQVGEESTDSYDMLYVFKNLNKTWLVDEIQFASPPKVGRKTMTWRTTHEMETRP